MNGSPVQRLSRRSLVGAALSAGLVATLPAARAQAAAASGPAAAGPSSGPPIADRPSGPSGLPGPSFPPLDPKSLQAAIDDLEHPRATGAQLRVAGTEGGWYGTSGLADRTSGRAIRPGDQVRIGSVSKTFIATVVLQLVQEGRIGLSRPVQRYLPGLLPDSYPDIRVVDLLRHTSGLPDESGPDLPDLSTPELILAHRHDRPTPRRLLARVTRGPRMKFAPGTKQEYRGVNYLLAALLVERVTGRPYGAEIDRRLARPLGLTRTFVPLTGDPALHGPHVHGYLAMSDGSLRDATVYDQASSYGDGAMVSTTTDLERFTAALFAGELLPPRLSEAMFTLPPAEVRMLDGSPARYSVGLQTATVAGFTFWGKTGENYGYDSGMFSTRDGRRRFVFSYTPVAGGPDQQRMTERIVGALTS